MTESEIQQLADKFGGKIVAKLPGCLDGAAGAAYAAGFYRARMQQMSEQDKRQANLAVSVNTKTHEALSRLSEQVHASAEQIAAVVPEIVVGKMNQPFQSYEQFAAALDQIPQTPGIDRDITGHPDSVTAG